MAVVDAQAGPDGPFFHAVFDRRGLSFVGCFGVQPAEPHGLVGRDLLFAFMQAMEFFPMRGRDCPGVGDGGANRLVHKACDGLVGLAGFQLDGEPLAVVVDDVPYGGAHLLA